MTEQKYFRHVTIKSPQGLVVKEIDFIDTPESYRQLVVKELSDVYRTNDGYVWNFRSNDGSKYTPQSAPKRIQRRRVKGWRMPPNTVSVCRNGRYGNPFPVTKELPAEESVRMFREWLTTDNDMFPEEKKAIMDNMKSDLRGKDLACFCKEDAEWCHGDVLLELANR